MDTCTISEAIKTRPNAGLTEWLRSIDTVRVYISVVTLGELRKGVDCCSDAARKAKLERWLVVDITQQFANRILPFDAKVADRWGRLLGVLHRGRVTSDAVDSLIAATALEHNLSVVTRNEKDFKNIGVGVTNPWSNR